MATKQQLELEPEVLPNLNTRYAYVIANKNERRGNVYDENGRLRGENEYPPYLNVLLESSILWDGSKDPFSQKPRAAGRHKIRYYDGCTTIFADDQPRDKETIDALVKGTRDIVFNFGYVFVFGYDTMLKTYLDWCSYNEDSPYRVPTVPVKFKNVNTEKNILAEGVLLELEDEVRELAKKASVKKMKIHCKYLGIALEDAVTSLPLSDESLRIEYRKIAKTNPTLFKNSYFDESIEISNWVKDAIAVGKISTTLIPNQATWLKGGVIKDISGLKDINLIVDDLVQFAKTEAGYDFAAQLKAIYSN